MHTVRTPPLPQPRDCEDETVLKVLGRKVRRERVARSISQENGCGAELERNGATRRSIRVAMDARYIRETPSGIGTYTQALVDRLPGAGASDQFIFWRHRLAPRPLSPGRNTMDITVRPGPTSP